MALFGRRSREPLTPEEAERKLSRLQKELESTEQKLSKRKSELDQVKAQTDQLGAQLRYLRGELSFELEMQEFGLYAPTYVFANSDLYKDRLADVRYRQKQMIKAGTACDGDKNWTVNGSLSQGSKMVKDMQKLLLRAFNVECDDIIAHVTVSNADRSRERIWKSAEQISKLGTIMRISINNGYILLKLEELNLALDFSQKKQEEKDRLRELREQQREEAKVQKEIAEQRKKLEKERTHYQNALDIVRTKLSADPDNIDLLAKQRELEQELAETNKAITDVDYRQANIRAGYVYVISNIGAFGRDVYKIGMTRRLEPLDRVDELGGASVPFQFDVHALIFTEDAPGLEAALHNAFEKQKVNKVNTRREFFRVSLDEIKREVREHYDKTVEWIDVPPAEQFRQSLRMTGAAEPVQIDRTLPALPEESAPTPPQETPVSAPVQETAAPPAPEPAAPEASALPQTPADAVRIIVQQSIPGCQLQEEDTPEQHKIHIYYPDRRKFGIVKIHKATGAIQLRKLADGMPQIIDLPNANALRDQF